MPSSRLNKIKERCIVCSLMTAAFVGVLTTIGIISVLLFETVSFFKEVSLWSFITDTQWTPLFTQKHFGIAPLLCGTLLISVIALFLAVPAGVVIAVFLSEFASPKIRSFIKPLLEILAGVPTVVYGYFALLFVTPFLKRFIPHLESFNALSPGLVMGIMILPLMSSLSEDALYAVPRSLKEAGYALGASRLQVAFTVVLPAALPGVLAAFILAMSRAIGETMLVTIAAGQQPRLTLNPLQAVETMTAFIVQVSLGDTPHGSLEYRTIFAVGSMLFVMTMVLNTISYKIKKGIYRL